MNNEILTRITKLVQKPASPILLIDRDNQNAGWCDSAEEALTNTSAASFAVQVQDDILALDADNETQSVAVQNAIAPLIKQAGINSVIVASGQPHHVHLFARVPDPMLRGEFAAKARKCGVDVREGSGLIRPPLAPHRLGLPVQLIQPASIDLLFEYLDRIDKERRLSRRIYKLLTEGDTEARYRSRSECIQAIACEAARVGLTEEWLYKALINPANIGGLKVQERLGEYGNIMARNYVARSYYKAIEYVNSNDRHPIQIQINEFINETGLQQWNKRGEDYEKAVLLAILQIAKRCNKISRIGASVREVAELSGIQGIATVSKAIGRLIRKRWLERLPGRRIYLNILPASLRNNTYSHSEYILTPKGGCDRVFTEREGCSPQCNNADIWRFGALGKRKHLIYHHLEFSNGYTTCEMAERCGMTNKSMYYHLPKMLAYRVADIREGKWYKLDIEPHYEKLADQREKHESQRMVNQYRLRSWADRRANGSEYGKPGVVYDHPEGLNDEERRRYGGGA